MQIEDIDLDSHAERFLKRKYGMRDWSSSTLAIREKSLRMYLDWTDKEGIDYTDVDSDQIRDHLLHLKDQDYAPNTIGMRYDTLQLFYRYLTKEADLYENNPMEDVERTSMMKGTKKHKKSDIAYVTQEEKEKLVEHCPSPKTRNRLIIRLLWQTGIRQGEAADIKLADIDRNERSILIYASKTDDTRTVFYQESLDFLLERWLDRGYRDSYEPATDSPYLFPSRRSPQISPDEIGKVVVRAAKDAGIQETVYTDAAGRSQYRITPHALRHGHAVFAITEAGIDIRTLQKALGHSNIETTQKYLQLTDDDVRSAYMAFGTANDEVR